MPADPIAPRRALPAALAAVLILGPVVGPNGAAQAQAEPPLACTRQPRRLHGVAHIAEVFHQPASDSPAPAPPRPHGAEVGALATPPVAVSDGYEPPPRVRVGSPQELEDTLRSGFTGIIVIPKGVFWDLGDRRDLPIRSGVWLLGERGDTLCERPTLYTESKLEGVVFAVSANDVRIEGIHFRGPQAGDRTHGQEYVSAIVVTVDRVAGLGKRILITDNEFNEWLGGGVGVTSAQRVRTLEEYDPGWPKPDRADAALVRVERNYMHHNALDGGGYGVVVGGGAYATIEGNVFDFNRHAVASDGYPYSGYIARYNYILQGGFMQGSYWNQHFDVHGTVDEDGDGGSDGYGSVAGEYFEITRNTIRGEQGYYLVKTRPTLMLRGKPTVGARFDANVDVHDDLDGAVSLKGSKNATGWGEDHGAFNFSATGNRFDTDYSSELATGDFDGDGRTDIFVANGTAWYVSRGGVEPWQLLHPSDKRVRDLGFADMNGDGITDVVWRAPDGALGYLAGGFGAVVPLTTAPVPMAELRFGDFDADGRTDIFRREASGQWMIWYGRTRDWAAAQSSSLPLKALRFGQFDGRPGTDVVAALSDQWAVSSSATTQWARLNAPLHRSLEYAVAADFDGDGRDDLAFDEGRQMWSVSRAGSGPLSALREGDGLPRVPELRTLLVGRFDGGRAARLVSFPSGGDNHFMIWRGGRRETFSRLSRAAMR